MIGKEGLYYRADTGSGGSGGGLDRAGLTEIYFGVAQQKGLKTLRETGLLRKAFLVFGEGLSGNVISGEAVDPENGKRMTFIIVNPTQEQREMAARGLYPADSLPSIPLGPEEQVP